jgi:hypothetical protein
MSVNQQAVSKETSNAIGHSIFASDWWLDALAPSKWDEVSIEKGGQVQARLPYAIRSTPFGKVLGMPVLTQTLGPSFLIESDKSSQRLSRYKALSEELIQKLPKHVGFRQNFHYSIGNWLPWYWAGFQQSTRYTYVLENLNDHTVLWDGFDQRIRRNIRKALKTIKVSQSVDFELFWNLNEKVFARQGIDQPYSKQTVERLDQACSEKEQRAIFIAEDQQGRAHAAVYIVWDDYSAYYLMGGSDPNLRHSGAQSLLMWEAIQFASTVTQKFDFEGSMIEPVERFFRAFGGTPKPYHCIWKMSPTLRAYQLGGRMFKRSMRSLRDLTKPQSEGGAR